VRFSCACILSLAIFALTFAIFTIFAIFALTVALSWIVRRLSHADISAFHILSVLLALAPVQAQMLDAVKHVKEGQEYLSNSPGQQQQEVREDNIFSDAVPTDKFSVCKDPSEARQSFYDFSSEDIEKLRNVSFSHQNYTGKVSLVVNLASF